MARFRTFAGVITFYGMQTTKDYIRQNLLRAAEDLFHERGYIGVSMRAVAARSGVGLSNIYNYFRSKDALFRAVVAPAMHGLERMLDEHHGHDGHDIMSMCRDEYYAFLVDEYTNYINRNRRLLAILLLKARGSSLDGYKAGFTRHATETVKAYFAEMKRRHPQLQTDISDFSIQVHSVWIFSMFEEILTRGVSPGDVPRVVGEYMTIEISGWRELMKI